MKSLILAIILNVHFVNVNSYNPTVITTWAFINSTIKAWKVLEEGGSALDAVEEGASVCEEQQCDHTVGYGGSPDENGETTLDALIMDGLKMNVMETGFSVCEKQQCDHGVGHDGNPDKNRATTLNALIMDGRTMNVGAVASLRRIKSAISVARRVLENTDHSILVGDLATQFAIQMGFKEEPLETPDSREMWKDWQENNCQPNFWRAVTPDHKLSCGPYKPMHQAFAPQVRLTRDVKVDRYNHDTIGMVALDHNGDVAAGTSSNGAKFKIPGRVGDSPIPGAGAYADNAVGGAASTGDGDVMLRFLSSFLAVEEMRRGASPTEAARTVIKRIASHYSDFSGAVVALTRSGIHGAACHGMPTFPYAVLDDAYSKPRVLQDVDVSEESSSDLENKRPEQPEAKEQKKKQKWVRKNACIFCDNLVTNFSRHLLKHHKNESGVLITVHINQ